MKLTARPVIALVLCAGLAGATGLTAASAAPKPVCNLVTDAKGDAGGPSGQNNDPVADIITSDVGTDAKRITAVVRVQKLAASSANYPYGLSWRLNFTIADTTYFMSAISDRSGVVGQTGFTDPATGQGTISGAATAKLDLAKNEVRITSNVTNFANRVNIKPGTALTALNSVTGAIAQVQGVGNLRYPTLDTAQGTTDYKAATRSCVPVGK